MPNSAPACSVRRKRRRWFIRIAVGAAILAFGIGAFVSFIADADLEDIYAKLDRDDANWRLEDLEAHRKDVPDDENSALQTIAVYAAMGGQRVNSQWFVFTKLFDKLPPHAQLNIQQLKFLQERMTKLDKALVEARKLKDMPYGRFPVNYAPDYYSTVTKDEQVVHMIMDLLQWDAVVRVHVREADGAIESCRALLNAARAVGDTPILTSVLHVRFRGQRLLAETLERALAQGQPSEPALKEVQQAIAIEIAEPTLRNAMRGDLAGFHHMMTSIETGKIPANAMNSAFRTKTKASPFWFIPGSLKLEHGDTLRLLMEVVAAADVPMAEQDAAFALLDAKFKKANTLSATILGLYTANIAFAHRRGQAQLRTAMTALAAERYRLANKEWPKTLDDLVAAKLLDAVPDDPFIAAPLRIRHLSGGIVIYSVGVDGKDNGGNVEVVSDTGESIDIGFRLWNVSARRQGPLPTVTIDASDYQR